ncbi:MAG: hypothetical protein OXU42_17695, partial [Deltaproteobacteria bacterium]|nr:hypothetical protein [Deltaproteobacteria bacterium]
RPILPGSTRGADDESVNNAPQIGPISTALFTKEPHGAALEHQKLVVNQTTHSNVTRPNFL